jgi:hypothetical protein
MEFRPEKRSLLMPIFRLTRDSGYADRLRAYKVVLDGTAIGDILNGESKEFSIPAGKHHLETTIDWCKSRVITFEADQPDVPHFRVKSNLRGLILIGALPLALISSFVRGLWLSLSRTEQEFQPA